MIIPLLPKTYKFYWKHYKHSFFIKYKKVLGHQYVSHDDSMNLYLHNNGLYNIPNWKDYECRLKKDWFEKTKFDIENEIRQRQIQ
tara:strand:+ start:2119 stop:2373 length:255 start_codon:yes stop_codon:yes gene_type:complete